jgi:hypothetical protein
LYTQEISGPLMSGPFFVDSLATSRHGRVADAKLRRGVTATRADALS